MGNVFETECVNLMRQNSHKLNPPAYLSQMISSQFRSPFCVYKAIKEVTQKRAVISYLFKK